MRLEGSVEQTGYVAYDAVPEVYRSCDIFVSPTYAEGFSNTILEAMALGLPVVSTRAVGVVDCIRDDENGLLAEPGDVPALAAALTRIIADPTRITSSRRTTTVQVQGVALSSRRYARSNSGGGIKVFVPIPGIMASTKESSSEAVGSQRYQRSAVLKTIAAS